MRLHSIETTQSITVASIQFRIKIQSLFAFIFKFTQIDLLY